MALPIVVTQCSMALMQFIDALMIGGQGNAALAAITPAGLLILTLSSFGTGFLACVGTFVGQSAGRGENRGKLEYGFTGILCAILLGVGSLAFYPTSHHVFGLFNHEIEVYELEIAYFRICLFALLPQMIASAISFYFVGLQSPKLPMVGALLLTVLNCLFNYGFIFGRMGLPELGFRGAAWGTVAASYCHCAFMAIMFVRHVRVVSPISARFHVRKLASIGIPTGIQDAIDVVSWGLIVVYLIGQFGSEHLAAATILIRCMQLSFLPSDGVGMALMATVARAIGGRHFVLAELQAKAGLAIIGSYMLFMALVFFLFRYPIMRIFTDDSTVIAIGARAMICVSIFQAFDALNIVYVQCLTGAGDTVWTSCVNLLLCAVILLGGGLLAIRFFPELGSLGVWIAAATFITIQGLAFRWRWNRKKWQSIALI